MVTVPLGTAENERVPRLRASHLCATMASDGNGDVKSESGRNGAFRFDTPDTGAEGPSLFKCCLWGVAHRSATMGLGGWLSRTCGQVWSLMVKVGVQSVRARTDMHASCARMRVCM